MTIIYTHNSSNLAKKIAKLRKSHKITQPDLANMVDCHVNTLSNWESGKSHITTELLIKIQIALSEVEPFSIATSKEITG